MSKLDPQCIKGKISFAHNPFSLPIEGESAFKKSPLDITAHQYDLVWFGGPELKNRF